MVKILSETGIPVVIMSSDASTDTVNGVPFLSVEFSTIIGNSSLLRIKDVVGKHINPLASRIKNDKFSLVTFSAATTKSPSFSRV